MRTERSRREDPLPRLPAYAELPRIDVLEARHAWEVFGTEEDLGRVSLLTPAVVAEAGRELVRGDVFNLSLPLDLPNPPWSPVRRPYVHRIFAPNRNSQDDYLDSFYLQASTQWDGLRHYGAREFGYFGGVDARGAGPEGDRLGIEKWAEHGIVGRGVVIDVARHLLRGGRRLDPRVDLAISVEMLLDTLESQGSTLRQGDIALLHTGYLDAYLAASEEERQDFSSVRDCPGLHAGEAMAEFLWDAGVVAVVADNPAVEDVPGSRQTGSLHRRLIPLLGFALGELFDLRALSADCEADGRYSCLFMAAPLNLPGGVGSPGNALALK